MSFVRLHSICPLEKIPMDTLNEILSNLSVRDIQVTAIISKLLSASMIQTTIAKVDSSLLKFVNFLKQNLHGKLSQDQLENLSIIVNGKTIHDSYPFGLNQIKFSILFIRSQILEIIKTLQLKDLEDLKNLWDQNEKPFFFDEIFELASIYKQIDERLINQPLGTNIDGKLFLPDFEELFQRSDFPKAANLINLFPSLLEGVCESLYEKVPQQALKILNKLLIFLPSNHNIQSSIDNVLSNIAQSFVSKGNIEGVEISQRIFSIDKKNNTLATISKILTDQKNFDLSLQVIFLCSQEFNNISSLTYLALSLSKDGRINDAMIFCKKLPSKVADASLAVLCDYWTGTNSSLALTIANEIESEKTRGEKFKSIADSIANHTEKTGTIDQKIFLGLVDFLFNHKNYALLSSLRKAFTKPLRQQFCEKVFESIQNKNSGSKSTLEELDLLFNISSDGEFLLHLKINTFNVELYKQWLSKGRSAVILHAKFCWLLKIVEAETFNTKIEFFQNITALPFFASLQQLTDSQYQTLQTLIDDSFLIGNSSLACKLLRFGYHKEKIELFKKHLKTIATLDLQVLFELVSNNPEIKDLFLPLFEEHSNYSKKIIDWFHSQSSEEALKAAFLLGELVESKDLLTKHLKNRFSEILTVFKDLNHSSPNAKIIMQRISFYFFIFLDQDNTRIEELSNESISNLFLYKPRQIAHHLKISTLDKILTKCSPSEKLLWEEDISEAAKINPEVTFISLKHYHDRSTFAFQYFHMGKNRNSILISLLKKAKSTEEYQMLVLRILSYLYDPLVGELKFTQTLNVIEIFSFYLLLLQDERCNLNIQTNIAIFALVSENANIKADTKNTMHVNENQTLLSLVNQGINHWLTPEESLKFNKISISTDGPQREFSLKSTIDYLKFLIEIKNEQDATAQRVKESLQSFSKDEITPDLLLAIENSCKWDIPSTIASQKTRLSELVEESLKNFSKEEITLELRKGIEDSCKKQLEDQDQEEQDQIVKDFEKFMQAKDEAKTSEPSIDDDLFYDSDEMKISDEEEVSMEEVVDLDE